MNPNPSPVKEEKVTYQEAVEEMKKRGWDSVGQQGGVVIVGPWDGNFIEGLGFGRTLEMAVNNAIQQLSEAKEK